jgi:hypothetical protein
MMRALLLAVLLASAPAAFAADVGRRVDAPYRFLPPDDRPTSPLDQEKARVYRDQLRDQLRSDQLNQIDRSASGTARLNETRRELNRMDNMLNTPTSPPSLPRTQSSQPLPVPNQNPLALDSLGPVLSGGGRHQPTPDEIKEREAARAEQQRKAGVDVKPVYDLFGQRIQ